MAGGLYTYPRLSLGGQLKIIDGNNLQVSVRSLCSLHKVHYQVMIPYLKIRLAKTPESLKIPKRLDICKKCWSYDSLLQIYYNFSANMTKIVCTSSWISRFQHAGVSANLLYISSWFISSHFSRSWENSFLDNLWNTCFLK